MAPKRKKQPPLPGKANGTQKISQAKSEEAENDDSVVVDAVAEQKARDALAAAMPNESVAHQSTFNVEDTRTKIKKTITQLIDRGFPVHEAVAHLLHTPPSVATSVTEATSHLLLSLPRASIPAQYHAQARERAHNKDIAVLHASSVKPAFSRSPDPPDFEGMRILEQHEKDADVSAPPNKDAIKRLAEVVEDDEEGDDADESDPRGDSSGHDSDQHTWQPGSSDVWEVWSDDRSVQRRQRCRAELSRSAMLEDFSNELKRLKDESLRGKSENNKQLKKRAGMLIKQLKDEMKQYGPDVESYVEEKVDAKREKSNESSAGKWTESTADVDLKDNYGIDLDSTSSALDEDGEQKANVTGQEQVARGQDIAADCIDSSTQNVDAEEAFELDSLFEEGSHFAQMAEESKTDRTAPTLDEIAPRGSEGRVPLRRPDEKEKNKLPKALLQTEAHALGVSAPRFDRRQNGDGQPGFCYICCHFRKGRGRGRSGKRNPGGYIKTALDEEEDGWSMIQDAQQAVAARALFELHYDDAEWSAQSLAEPYASLWLYWQEQRKRHAKLVSGKVGEEIDKFVEQYMSIHSISQEAPMQADESERKVESKTTGLQDQIPSKKHLSNEKLKEALLCREESDAYQKIAEQRQNLPIMDVASELMNALENSNTVVISGETGCGKTTQVPQIIYDSFVRAGNGSECNLMCTQPRRVAAVSVAQRVAHERLEKSPGCKGAAVGYQVRLDSAVCKDTQLLFCTTGILLRKIQADPLLRDISHIVMDEVHERSLESDFAAALLRDLLRRRREAGLKQLSLVLMSATINADLFSSYLGDCPVVHAAGRTHPVDVYFLEDTIESLGYVLSDDNPSALQSEDESNTVIGNAAASRSFEKELVDSWGTSPSDDVFGRVTGPNPDFNDYLYRNEYSKATRRTLARLDENVINLELVECLTESLHVQLPIRDAILVFLPGVGEITALINRLRTSPQLSKQRLLPLHASLPSEEQRRVFERPSDNERKIIAATNIGETSITVDDVVAVVDTGKLKEVQYYPQFGMSSLEEAFVSKASAKQRAGRAGRTQPGVCYRLYTRCRYDHKFRSHQVPEIKRVPLAEVVLQAKQLVGNDGSAKEMLDRAPEPPNEETVNAALKELREVGALQNDRVTALGLHLATFPVDVRVGKVLVLGTLLGCCSRAITTAAAMSHKSPFLRSEHAEQVKAEFAKPVPGSSKGTIASGQYSDQLVIVAAFESYKQVLQKHGRNKAMSFCRSKSLDAQILDGIDDMRQQFATLLTDNQLVGRPSQVKGRLTGVQLLHNADRSNASWNANGNRPRVLRAVLGGALHAHIAKWSIKSGSWCDAHGLVALHPGSVLANISKQGVRFVAFHEKFKTGKTYVCDCTAVSPAMLLMFGGDIDVQHDKAQITIDGWIGLKAGGEHAALFSKLRQALDGELGKRIKASAESNSSPSMSSDARDNTDVVDAVVSLLESETR